MKIYEIGTGYTSIPAKISAATEIIVEQLTKAMLKQGVDVQIVDICDYNRAENNLPILEVEVPKKFVDADVQLGIMHKLKRVVYSVSLALTLKKILKTATEKVVFHFHNQYNMYFFMRLVPKSLRNKCVIAYTNHSGIWRLDWSEIEQTIKKRYFQEVDCMKKADLVYLLNDETKYNAMNYLGVKEEHIVRINNGVNTEIYHPLSAEEKRIIREKYDFSGKTIILQVGSVYENKGQLRAIEMLRSLMKINPSVVYAYAGGIVSEEYQTQIKEYAKMNGIEKQVCYMGMLSPGSELNELYNVATATIFPSRYEAFGLVVIEAMSAGIPVLIHKSTPFSFGEGCIVYGEDDFEDVVNSIIREDDIFRTCAEKARENAVRNYSWDKVASDYVQSWK